MKPLKDTLALILYFALACATALQASTGCSEENEASPPGDANNGGAGLSDTGEAVLEQWVLCATTGYEDFQKYTSDLHEAATALCGEPTEATLEAARASYHDARRTWLGLRTFAIGPEVEYPLRYGPKIDFRPPRYDDIEAVLSSSDDLLPPAETGAQLRGFPAIEWVLFGPNSAALTGDGRACAFLLARTSDLHENASGLALSWDAEGADFASEILAESGTSTFDTPFEAFSGLVNRMGYVVENMRDQDILAPLGADAESVQIDLVVSRVSQRTNEDFLDTLLGLEKLFFGTEGSPGLNAYAKENGVNLEGEVQGALTTARATIEAVPAPYANALSAEREKVEEADAALKELQLLFQIDLMGRLMLPQVFNDADGD